jgi:hypothetical protein
MKFCTKGVRPILLNVQCNTNWHRRKHIGAQVIAFVKGKGFALVMPLAVMYMNLRKLL